MPRITRIRVTNIQYDHGKKQLPDIIIQPNGLDTVLLLANGGGKTLLIQLIMQTILPNEKMSGRRIADLLQSNRYTGHVAVEWLLDDTGERRQFLCTGFCFSNGQNNDQKIRYYNYLFDYDDRSELTIETLPLIKNSAPGTKHPSSYMQLRDYLREEGGHRVQIFDQINTYQERLKLYQILPEEWKNICNTNGSEGGVDKFFAKSKTTQQLMDNLLIPSVEEMIFQSERKKKELVHAFAEYRNMLIEIPLIKKNIQDFEAIRDHAEAVVAEVQKFDKLQKDFDDKTKELIILAKTFSLHESEAVKLINDLTKEIEESNNNLQELRWQSKSYDVFLKQLDYQKALAEEEKIKAACAVQQALLADTIQSEKEVKALYFYKQSETAKQEVNIYQQQLKLMEQAEPELQSKLDQKKIQLRGAWEIKQQQLQKQHQSKEATLKSFEVEFKELIKKIKNARVQEKEWRNQLAGIRAWFEQYKEQQQQLRKYVSEAAIINPEQGLQKHNQALNSYQVQQTETKDNIQKITACQSELQENIINWHNEKNAHQSRVEALNEKLNQIAQEEDAVRGLLAEHEMYTASLFDEKDKVLFWVRDNLREVQEKRVGVQAELANLQEKWVQLEGRNYYIPHNDLLKIKKRLEKAGIYALLGSEWLAEQDISEAEKEAYLKHQPLLPYAILIEANQVNAVKYAMKQTKEWSQDIPLLFLVKSSESLRSGSGTESFLPLWHNDLLIYQPDSVRMFTSAAVFQVYKEQMEENINQKQQSLQQLKNQENVFVHLKERVESFYRRYTGQEVSAWEKTKTELEKQIKLIAQNIEAGKKQQQHLKEQLKHAEETLEELKKAQNNEEKIIEKLQEYLKRHKLHSQKYELEKQYVDELSKLEQQLTDWEKQKDKNVQQRMGIEQNIKKFLLLLKVIKMNFNITN